MASDPLAGYTPTADPLAGYSPAAAPGADPGNEAIWNKPANVSWSDYMLAHLKNALPATNPFDVHTNVNEGLVLGSGLSGGLSGFIPGVRERTAQAEQEMPMQERIALQGAGYALGPGKLGIASKLGEALGGSYLAGVGGAAGEGAIASGVGAAGEGGSAKDIAKAAGIGALGGAGGGALGGVVGRGGTLTPAIPEADLRSAATAAYAPLDAIVFHGPSQVTPAFDAVKRTMTDAEQDLAKSTIAKANKLAGVTDPNTGVVKGGVGFATGADLQSYQRLFKDLAQSGTAEDRQFAPKFHDALEDIMQNTTPVGRNVTPGQGMSFMPPGNLGAPGFAAGDAAAARDAGNIPFGRAEDLNRLQGWEAKSAVAGGPDVGGQASAWLRSPEGQTFAKPGTPQYNAINNLAATNAGPDLAAPSAFDIRHAIHPLATAVGSGLVGGAGAQLAEGHFDPAHLAMETALGAGLGYGLHAGIPWATKRYIQGPAQQRALDAARSTLSTGQYQAPVLPEASFRDAIRSLIFGQGAAGRF
jgi:hypothetical protein